MYSPTTWHLILGLAILLGWGCPAPDRPVSDELPPPLANASPPEVAQGKYYPLSGEFNNQPLRIHLVRYGVRDADSGRLRTAYRGLYYSAAINDVGHLISTGAAQPDGRIQLLETAPGLVDPIYWELAWDGDDLSGVRRVPGMGLERPVELSYTPAQARIPLDVYWLAAAHDTDDAVINLQALYVPDTLIGEDRALNAIWQFFPGLVGDSLTEQFGDPAGVLQDLYRQLDKVRPRGRSYHDLRNVTVLANGKDRVALAFEQYRFTGGGEGQDRQIINFSLPDFEPLTLDNVLPTGYEEPLRRQIREQASMRYQTADSDPIAAEQIYIPDTYAILEEGILFVYPPNTFNDWGPEEQEVFVPYEKLGAS